MIVRTLREDEFDAIHRAFVDAFSDYVVPMHPTQDALREMFTRRGWVPELSSGMVPKMEGCLHAVRGEPRP